MIGIVFAMLEEAKPYAAGYNWKEVDLGGKFTTYEGKYLGEDCLAIVSGVGKVNAGVATMALIHSGVNKIFNIGSCGANAENLKVGDIVSPGKIYDGDFDLSKFGKDTKNPYNLPQGEGLILYSFSKFVTEKVNDEDYIVDMECYEIACICDYFKVTFIPVKVVSDNANENAHDVFDDNIDNVMERSVDKVEQLIKERLKDAK